MVNDAKAAFLNPGQTVTLAEVKANKLIEEGN